MAVLVIAVLTGLRLKGLSHKNETVTAEKAEVVASAPGGTTDTEPQTAKGNKENTAETQTVSDEALVPSENSNSDKKTRTEANPSGQTTATTAEVPSSEDNTPEEHLEAGIVGGEPTEQEVVTIVGDNAWTEWDTFLSLSPEEQDAYMQSFESPEAFAAWMVSAQQEWADAHPTEEIGPGGVISFGK